MLSLKPSQHIPSKPKLVRCINTFIQMATDRRDILDKDNKYYDIDKFINNCVLSSDKNKTHMKL